MKINQIESGYASSNTYFISKGKSMIVIDPCLEIDSNPKKLYEAIEGYQVEAILITHAHFDHISGIDAIVKKQSCPVYVFHSETAWLKDPNLNLSTMIPEAVSIHSALTPIDLGILKLENFEFEVIQTSGHTHGSISFLLENHCFCGDFIFKNSVGRMDLPTGSQSEMINSICHFIDSYQNQDLILYPGHGPITKLSTEIKYNPFIQHIL